MRDSPLGEVTTICGSPFVKSIVPPDATFAVAL